jgi:hypothetical protein
MVCGFVWDCGDRYEIAMSSHSHQYQGDCTSPNCVHGSDRAIYSGRDPLAHWEGNPVHTRCYNQLYNDTLRSTNTHQNTTTASTPQQPTSYIHNPIVIAEPSYSHDNNNHISLSQSTITHTQLNSHSHTSTLTTQQQRVLELLHSFIEHFTYQQYWDTMTQAYRKEQYYHYIRNICTSVRDLYTTMINDTTQHMKQHTNSHSKYKVAMDFSWDHRRHATGGWMPMIDVESDIVLNAALEYKSRVRTEKNGEKKILFQGNYPNDKSAHAMEMTAFLKLIEQLRHNNLLDSIDTIISDEHTGMEGTIRRTHDLQHMKHLHDPFHIGKNRIYIMRC